MFYFLTLKFTYRKHHVQFEPSGNQHVIFHTVNAVEKNKLAHKEGNQY